METNVGGYDRLARLALGPLLLLVGVAVLVELVDLGLAVAVPALLVGLVFTVTGFVQKCPLNSLLGVDTCSR